MSPRARGRSAPKPAPASLAARVTTAPVCTAPEAARRKLDEYLGAGRRAGPGAALAKVFSQHPKARALVEGLADGSPFLWDLAARDPARLARLLQSEPEARFEALLAETAAAIDATAEEPVAAQVLRRAKAEAALLIALADIGGLWPVPQVTRALTRFADAAISCALRFLLRQIGRAHV